MTYVARVSVGDGFGCHMVTGRGATPEQAQQDCYRQIGAEILIELAEGVLIPSHLEDKVPTVPDAGYQLVVFERTSHNSGDAYNWRFFALPFGRYLLGDENGELEITASAPVLISTLDSNCDVDYPLPNRSVEYVDGQWLPAGVVGYNY